MHQVLILQVAHGAPDVSASAATSTAFVSQWGLPATHTPFLQELTARVAMTSALRLQPRVTLQRLQERQERVMLLGEGPGEEEIITLTIRDHTILTLSI